MDIIHLALKTEFNFKKTYAHIDKVVEFSSGGFIGVADCDNVYSHIPLQKICEKKKLKQIFGVRLMVCSPADMRERASGPITLFIAKNDAGLVEINGLVKKAWDNFYYTPRISIFDLVEVSDDVYVIAENFISKERIDYIALNHKTSKRALDCDIQKVAIINNDYLMPEDRQVYELFTNPKFETHTYPQHVLSTDEWLSYFKDVDSIRHTHTIANNCNAKLRKAENVRSIDNLNLRDLCIKGAFKRKINLGIGEYRERLDRELMLISEKDFSDYFIIVADIVNYAKKFMLVGPSRGSSAGSLVCYLLGITEINPLEYGLIFERFVDINRADLPDIDIDFPDSKRDMVFEYVKEKYGEDKVGHLGTISSMKPKIAISEFAKSLGIPAYKTDDVKNSIVERSGGDARAALCMEDTFTTTEVGKKFIDEYPSMILAKEIENHSRHSGVHAAGIVITNDSILNYAASNSRDGNVMVDKSGAEYLNLLKIDCLGLRTLSILEDCAKLSGYDKYKYYSLPLDDKKVFNIFNTKRLSGIFQFEGYALKALTEQMGVHRFDDIVAITSLARPGPLHSGGAALFVERRTGREKIEYLSQDENFKKEVKDTFGIIIYQEQLMSIGKNYGDLSWEDVSSLRRAASRSLGEEFFNKYLDNFLKGTRSRGIDDSEAIHVWKNMVTFGSWGFNKSHAVSYGLISYWTAWAKVYHPLEFAAANLNHTKNPESAIKLLRDMVKNDGVEYCPVDPDCSDVGWTIKDGKLLGGLTNIDGIGISKAEKIIKNRQSGKTNPPSVTKSLLESKTKFDTLYPCSDRWHDIYDNPKKYGLDEPPVFIENLDDETDQVFIGKLTKKNLRDLNEYASVVKRGGEIIHHNNLFLYIHLEDDTGSIIGMIDRFNYDRIGRDIVETGVVDNTWYLVKGEFNKKYKRLKILEILDLNKWLEGIGDTP